MDTPTLIPDPRDPTIYATPTPALITYLEPWIKPLMTLESIGSDLLLALLDRKPKLDPVKKDPENEDMWYIGNHFLGTKLNQAVLHRSQLRDCLEMHLQEQQLRRLLKD